MDFCCKLSAGGWQHLLAADTFVFHEGGVSFGAKTDELKVAAQAIVDERYPDYGDSIQRWIEIDPALPYRLAVDLARVNRRAGPKWLFISHAYGGGVQQHIDDLAALICDELDGVVWLLQPRDDHSLRLTGVAKIAVLTSRLPMTNSIRPAAAGFELGIQRLHFHHFAGLPASVLQLPKFYACLLMSPSTTSIRSARRHISLPATATFVGGPMWEAASAVSLSAPTPGVWVFGTGVRLLVSGWLRRSG